MCLEITSQHAKKPGEKYGGRKNTKHRHGIAAHQDSRAKEGKQAGQAAHDYHIAYGTAENFLGVPVFLSASLWAITLEMAEGIL